MRPVARVLAAVAIASATVTVGLVPAGPVAAHTEPVGISPDPGARLAAPPATVNIRFDAELDARDSTADLVDEQGHVVADGTVDLAALDHRTLRLAVPTALPEGAYAVRWRVRSVADRHLVTGEAGFAVGTADPAGALARDDDASRTSAGRASGRSRTSLVLWLVAFVAGVAFLGYAALPRRAAGRDDQPTKGHRSSLRGR